jgi:hypothetical protein
MVKKPRKVGTGGRANGKKPRRKRGGIEVSLAPDGPTPLLGPFKRPPPEGALTVQLSRSQLKGFVTRAIEYMKLRDEPEFQSWIRDAAKKP